eukprot:TRINITY_DN11058_c0_g1_i1.p1 TRINITY_DN11058_c0_g1~~TRINITY_DN11058_c0_g1_i1.p1  ORF type:complete len:249 (-),score=52.82 TRINITY_DN11058_c0_g1_i1:96-842(-)
MEISALLNPPTPAPSIQINLNDDDVPSSSIEVAIADGDHFERENLASEKQVESQFSSQEEPVQSQPPQKKTKKTQDPKATQVTIHSAIPEEVSHFLYVNPKQYHRILVRRQARAKMEAQNRIIKNTMPYLHESRHVHAKSRKRNGKNGRFTSAKDKELEEEQATMAECLESLVDEENPEDLLPSALTIHLPSRLSLAEILRTPTAWMAINSRLAGPTHQNLNESAYWQSFPHHARMMAQQHNPFGNIT